MRSYGQFCGLARSLDVVGSRWTLLIVRELLLGPQRYSDLRAALPGIANNLLADRLRDLEADGLLRRRTLPPPAAASVYELTERGQALDEVVFALMRWGAEYMGEPADDLFRPRWLALVLRAYLPRTAPRDARVRARLHVGDTTLVVDSTGGAVRVEPDGAGEADLELHAQPETVLAVASGARSLPSARRAGGLGVRGPREAVTRLERLFAAIDPQSSMLSASRAADGQPARRTPSR